MRRSLLLAGFITVATSFTSLSALAEDVPSLRPCPSKPNCVSSKAAVEDKHYIAPIAYSGDKTAAMRVLVDALHKTEGARVVRADGHYLYATFESKLFGFVDDVEFIFDHSEPRMAVRSASRVGHFDFGANRKRIETLRQIFINSSSN